MMHRTALVTGGTSGIGFEVSKKLAADGVHLILTYHKDDTKAEGARRELATINPGVDVSILRQDFAQLSQAPEFFERLDRTLGHRKLDYFVSSHGKIGSDLFLFKSRAEILEMINQHLIANVLLTHHVLKGMCVRKFGRVIYVTSLASKKINRGQADYALSKAGLEVLVKSLTAEYYHRQVTFNCVSCGLVDTRVSEKIAQAYAEKKNEVGRIVRKESVANLVMMLLSDWAADISGATYAIDGGQAQLGNNMAYHRLSFGATHES